MLQKTEESISCVEHRDPVFHGGSHVKVLEFTTTCDNVDQLCSNNDIPCFLEHLATGEKDVGMDWSADIETRLALGDIGGVCRCKEYVLIDHISDLWGKF